MKAKAIRIREYDGQSYRSLGSWGITGITLMLEFQIEGGGLGQAKLDRFFRRRLGSLTESVRSDIGKTMPEEVDLFTQTRRGSYGGASRIYIIRKETMEAWLVRVKEAALRG